MSAGVTAISKQAVAESSWLRSILVRHGRLLLVAPALFLLAIVYGAPVLRLLLTSFGTTGWSLGFYREALTDSYMWRVLFSTLRLSAEVTALCLVLGYPVAYLMNRTSPGGTRAITILVMLPVWTSVLVRAYAWMVLLGRNGVANQLLLSTGLISDPIQLLYNRFSVYVGMVHYMLPYMILPLYTAMKRVDTRLVDAARSAGASRFNAFVLVFIPLTVSGIAAGSLLVFILSLGFYVTPALLGGPADVTFVMLIDRQVNESLNWELAAAMAIVLLMTTLVLVAIYWKLVDNSEQPVTPNSRARAVAPLRILTRVHGKIQSLSKVQFPALGRLVTPVIGWTVVAFLIAPILIFFPLSLSASPYLEFPPRGLSLQWFENYFHRTEWVAATLLSIKVATLTMIAATLLGTLAAIGLVRSRFPGLRLLNAFLISPTIVPTLIVAVAIYFQFARFKLIGSTTGLVLAHLVIALPLVIVVVSGVLRSVDLRPEQAARSLGAGPAVAFMRITLPTIRPGILTAALFAFLTSFDDVVLALFLSGTSAITLPKRMWDGIRFEVDPTIAAASTLMIVVSILLLGASQLLASRPRRGGSDARGEPLK